LRAIPDDGIQAAATVDNLVYPAVCVPPRYVILREARAVWQKARHARVVWLFPPVVDLEQLGGRRLAEGKWIVSAAVRLAVLSFAERDAQAIEAGCSTQQYVAHSFVGRCFSIGCLGRCGAADKQ
jgi:hypothetical protein